MIRKADFCVTGICISMNVCQEIARAKLEQRATYVSFPTSFHHFKALEGSIHRLPNVVKITPHQLSL